MAGSIARILGCLLLAMVIAVPSEAAHRRAAHHTRSTHHTRLAAPRAAAAPSVDMRLVAEQVLLARAGFSPAAIDGRKGDNGERAVHAFQEANGLPVGPLDAGTAARLRQGNDAPILGRYTIQPQDVAGPFTPQIPGDFVQMAQLPRLSYTTPRELLAEKFHMSEGLLAALNRGADFARAGTAITVANIGGTDPAAVAETQKHGGPAKPPALSGSSTAPTAARIVVDKQARAVDVYGPDNRLIAFYPASIGSTEKPAPSGTFAVTTIVRNPDYTYNPAYAFKGQQATQPVKVPPGPNNPVGIVWIGLTAKGYGIHGTANPDTVGKTQSHGCVRLTNWDALALARLVKKGTPVAFAG
jgi:lipoprotein-anchoring transpeptidase ErfK/SrfK